MMSEAQCTSVTQRQVTPQLYTGLAVCTTNEEVQEQRRNVSRPNRKEISLGSQTNIVSVIQLVIDADV